MLQVLAAVGDRCFLWREGSVRADKVECFGQAVVAYVFTLSAHTEN
jgi:hypothetical protein